MTSRTGRDLTSHSDTEAGLARPPRARSLPCWLPLVPCGRGSKPKCACATHLQTRPRTSAPSTSPLVAVACKHATSSSSLDGPLAKCSPAARATLLYSTYSCLLEPSQVTRADENTRYPSPHASRMAHEIRWLCLFTYGAFCRLQRSQCVASSVGLLILSTNVSCLECLNLVSRDSTVVCTTHAI